MRRDTEQVAAIAALTERLHAGTKTESRQTQAARRDERSIGAPENAAQQVQGHDRTLLCVLDAMGSKTQARRVSAEHAHVSLGCSKAARSAVSPYARNGGAA